MHRTQLLFIEHYANVQAVRPSAIPQPSALGIHLGELLLFKNEADA